MPIPRASTSYEDEDGIHHAEIFEVPPASPAKRYVPQTYQSRAAVARMRRPSTPEIEIRTSGFFFPKENPEDRAAQDCAIAIQNDGEIQDYIQERTQYLVTKGSIQAMQNIHGLETLAGRLPEGSFSRAFAGSMLQVAADFSREAVISAADCFHQRSLQRSAER